MFNAGGEIELFKRQLVKTRGVASLFGEARFTADLYYAVGAEQVGRPDVNESDRIAWVAIDDALKMIERGEIVGAAT